MIMESGIVNCELTTVRSVEEDLANKVFWACWGAKGKRLCRVVDGFAVATNPEERLASFDSASADMKSAYVGFAPSAG